MKREVMASERREGERNAHDCYAVEMKVCVTSMTTCICISGNAM